MSFREPINSETLQKNFPEVYREFFARNHIVLSTSLDARILNDGNTRFRGMSIRYNIPLRVYCGINALKKEQSKFWHYNLNSKQFVESKVQDNLPLFYNACETFLQRLGIKLKDYSIDIIAEGERGMGLGTTAKIAILVPIILSAYCKNDPLETGNLGQISLSKNRQEELISLAIDFHSLFKKKNVDPGGICSVFSHSINPNYCITGKAIETFKDLQNPPPLSDIRYGNMEDVFSVHEMNRFFDLYYFHTGKKNPIISYYELYKNDKMLIDQPLLSIRKLKKDFLPFLQTESLYVSYLQLLYDLSFRFFYALGQFLEDPIRVRSLNRVLRSINEYADLQEHLDTEETESHTVLHDLQKLLSSKGVISYGMFRSGNYQTAGGLGLITEFDKNRQVIWDIYQEMKEKYPSIELAYVSFIDGDSSVGLKLEKWDTVNKWSSFDGAEHFELKDLEKNKHVLSSMDDIKKYTFDVLLDEIQNKLFIQGETISSKDLHSQRMTIDMLKILMERLEEDVPNTAFPISSYMQNKNEIQGKIIIPLTKLILEKTGKKIHLSCKGSNTKFFLKLGKSDLTIGMLYSVGS